jgi:hypothetical protein
LSWQRQELRELELLHFATKRWRKNFHIRIKLGEHLTASTARRRWFRRIRDNPTATKSPLPCTIAAATAHRSAQIVNPRDMFSMSQETKILPDFVIIAAPTANLEYGA